MKLLYCPVCGSEINIIAGKCNKCNTDIKPKESKYDLQYYMNEAEKIYSDCGDFFRILYETEIFNNPYFNKEKYDLAQEIQSEIAIETFKKINNNLNNQNLPKCPTCQSTKIKKISATKKVAHGLTFGLFSKTARSQFECCNCGYKW